MEGPSDMATDKALLDQLLAGRKPPDLFAKGGLIDALKKALAERMLPGGGCRMAWAWLGFGVTRGCAAALPCGF